MSWDIDVLVNGAGIIEGGAIVDVPGENCAASSRSTS
jgi:hypothetical protein